MGFDPWGKIFRCDDCRDKRKRGCKHERRVVVEIPCICDARKTCTLCRGTGKIKIKRCPAATSREPLIARLLPYFYRYKATNEYPDGRGRIEQPEMLTDALDLMTCVAARKEAEKMEKAYGKSK